ncbi:MAG: proteasome accessory factor [Nocardioidaceae bacterium]|jgi:proteasome accessory factor B|nr:proteasome accessory factor [Nocardioidaceae bacterium]
MTAKKSERLMNLTICLLVSRHFISKDRIRSAVDGYRDLSDDAFDRMFDRDKEELRILGVPIEVGAIEKGFEDEVGYRIRRDRFELPEISLEADEAAVVGLAARVWQHASLATATTQGLRKLRAGGVDVDESALSIIEPQLATDEPAFDPVFEAVTTRRPIEFPHQRPGRGEVAMRHLEPWGIVSWHGHWYVVGHDRDRDAERMFRLSRIVGDVRFIGPPDSYAPPPDLQLRRLAESLAPPRPRESATVRVRAGTAAPLRRRASRSRPVDDGWTELELAYASGQTLADELLSYGPDVVVVAPPEVRESVVRQLSALAGAAP